MNINEKIDELDIKIADHEQKVSELNKEFAVLMKLTVAEIEKSQKREKIRENTENEKILQEIDEEEMQGNVILGLVADKMSEITQKAQELQKECETIRKEQAMLISKQKT